MSSAADRPAQGDGHCAAGRTVFVSLELSRTKWLVMSLSPGSAKMAKHVVTGGDGDALLALLAQLCGRAEERCGAPAAVVAIHEASLDGFWVHRLLEANGVERHVVEAASIAMPRRHRRAKTDAIDGRLCSAFWWHSDATNHASARWHSVGCHIDNAKGERVWNTGQAAILPRPWLSGRRRPVVAAARSQRKSPEKPMCSQVSGEVWARSSSDTGWLRARRCATASAM
jgi:hypothetical protein